MDTRLTEVHINRRGKKLYRWKINKLQVMEKTARVHHDVAKNAVNFFELLETRGISMNGIEWERG